MPLNPKKWQRIEPSPTPMVPPPAAQEGSPYVRTTLPASQQLQSDIAKQTYLPTIPAIRLNPLSLSGQPGVNAAVRAIPVSVRPTPTPVPPAPPALIQYAEVNPTINPVLMVIGNINGIPI